MSAMDIFNFVAPIFKAHPWLNWVILVSAILAVTWSFTPHVVKVRIGKIPRIGPRIVALFDIASAIAMMVLGKILGALWHGLIKGEIKPERIDRVSAETLVREALKQVTAADVAAMAHASAAPAAMVAGGGEDSR